MMADNKEEKTTKIQKGTVLRGLGRQHPIVHILIPARGGSKGIPRKNIRLLGGKPLIAHSIELALASRWVDKDNVVVSTDDEQIATIAKKWGASVPFMRPASISGDLATDYECFKHYVDFLRIGTKPMPEIIVHLRPTYPIRTVKLLDGLIEKFMEVRGEYDSLRTVAPVEKSPYKMYYINGESLVPVMGFPEISSMGERGAELYNMPRQVLPKCYLHNGCIDIVNVDTIIRKKSMTGDYIYPYIMNAMADATNVSSSTMDSMNSTNGDIDTEKDWQMVEKQL